MLRFFYNNHPSKSSKMAPRPPFLSALDYIFYLRRQVEKERMESNGLDLEETKENSCNMAGLGLSLESPKFSDLLRKLAEDLRTSSTSFVEDFIEEPNNGISWLLDLLRITLNRQQCPGMVSTTNEQLPKNKLTKTRNRQYELKKAITDEYDCLLSLKNAVTRTPKALTRILYHRNGLSTLASCIVSNLIKSRLIALELLTKLCTIESNGGKKVLEAMSTMRIIFGESVRFKLLIAILNSGNGVNMSGFELSALTFLNVILSQAPNPAQRVRLQCELEEAGLDISALEMKFKEKDLPFDDPIWREIKIWKENFIDVTEILKTKQFALKETLKLKDEVSVLRKAVSKLEEDKISLMQIERELKEKCEDLEAEIMITRARLNESGIKLSSRANNSNINNNNNNKSRPGSDNSDPVSVAADSGRWSDSEGCDNQLDIRRKSSSFNGDNFIEDQNVRNEDIFIYIPSIRPPASFTSYTRSETKSVGIDSIDLKEEIEFSNKEKSYTFNHKLDHNVDEEDNWKNNGSLINSSPEAKPTIVEMYPKKTDNIRKSNSNSRSNENSCSLSMVGADCEDIEMTLDWQYPLKSEDKDLSSSSSFHDINFILTSENNRKSHSLTHLTDIHQDKFKDIRASRSSNQFLLRSRGSSTTSLHEIGNKPIITNPLYKLEDIDNQRHYQYNTSKNKPRKFASNLQSYFFSGSGSSKTSKKFSKTSNLQKASSNDEDLSQHKSFPLPNAYKKNFIIKGHSNCGLFSGENKDLTASSSNLNVSINDNKDPALNDNVSKLVHREIALAAKELGAWF